MPATSPRRAVLALTAFGLMAGTAAHAQDGGLFEALFGRSQAAPQQPVAQPQVQVPVYGYGSDTGYRRRSHRVERPRPRTRYTALHKPEPLKVKITDRQTPLDMSAGPAAALMRDETLRPGDIVILKSGPQVYTGGIEKRHTLRDFEPAQSSRLIGKQTRRQLAAMVTPVGALPADEARRVLARMKRGPRSPAALPEQATAQASPIRVINAWTPVR
ncbi:hypothetical protein [Methylobacterium gregans]|uniref:Uncharacterized protein n=1 Tax=Methylobacterium gregans TaxID=374424 RepID=A0AA37HNI3_9HYPH|nr:hypothetical protein [Methylobacterium gregans]MDQ0520385.1 hypothetical protein [Methylobacterium gregans]GJD79039.1 hypothetical protein NBEOAGPD_2259 [Methylobacterium gregans]GLS52357.1 hypothetical protein GCM10007886_05390 [Methylobacterium gregans]